MQHDFLTMWHNWHHNMLIVSSVGYHCIPYIIMIKMRGNLIFLLCDTTDIISSTTAFLRSRWSKWCVTWHFWHVMPLPLGSECWLYFQWNWHQHDMIPGALSRAHHTDVSTCIKSHTIHLNNHLNIRNAMVSLMAPSRSCDREHVFAM